MSTYDMGDIEEFQPSGGSDADGMEDRYAAICDEVDACAFSGSLISSPSNRAGFRLYVERWMAEIQSVEESEKEEK